MKDVLFFSLHALFVITYFSSTTSLHWDMKKQHASKLHHSPMLFQPWSADSAQPNNIVKDDGRTTGEGMHIVNLGANKGRTPDPVYWLYTKGASWVLVVWMRACSGNGGERAVKVWAMKNLKM